MSDGWTYQLTFQGETFELSDGEQIAGRSRACDISVPDASVSRKHARLKPGPGHILIQDLNSSNGTFINDRRVQGEGAAEDGDTLRFGDAEVRVAIDNPAAYQTMRLPTGGAPGLDPNRTGPATVAIPAQTVPSQTQPSQDPASDPAQQLRKPPGPATTMLAAESVKLAAQAEVDRQAAEAAAAGQAADSISVVPAAPGPAAPSPHETQRFDSSNFVPISPGQQTPAQEPPSSTPTPQAPLPREAQESVPEPASQPQSESAAEPPSSPLSTQRVPLPHSDDATPAPPAPTVPSAPAVDPGVDPAATRRLEIPPQPTQPSQPTPEPPAEPVSSPPPAPPPAAPAATVAMTREQLEAARAEIDSSHAPPAQPTRAPREAPSPAPAPESSTGATEAPAPAPAAETPIFGTRESSQFQGFDFEEDDLGSSEVRPPDDFVPGSGRAWQEDSGEEAPAADVEFSVAEPPGVDSRVAAPEPTDESPTFGAPTAESPAFTMPELPEVPQVPDLPMPEVPSVDAAPDSEPAPESASTAPGVAPSPPSPSAPSAPDQEPNFDRPVGTWAEKPPMDGDATFAQIDYDSGAAPQPVDEDSWEPPEIEQQRFDRPTPPAAPVRPARTAHGPSAAEPAAPLSSGFSQPMPPAAPPPEEMPREERVAGGAGGLLPTLDELDGSIAGPEMDLPYQPDRDPTAPVPVVVVNPRRRDAGAGFVLRALATLLDLLWISALTIAAWMVTGNNQLVSMGVSLACQLGIVVGWALWGTSPGKKALGLAVEGKTPSPPGGGIGFLRAVIRAAGYLVSGLILGIGFLMIAFTPEKRGLHDRIAGTWVRRRG